MTLGIDAAGQDANQNPDWHAAYTAGARFAYLRMAYWSVVDKFYVAEVDRARAAGIVTGGYYAPELGPRASAAKAQIAACKRAGNVLPGKDLPLMIDVEGGANGFSSWGWSKPELVEFLRQLAFEAEDQLGHTPGIYTSFGQYWDLGCPPMPWASDMPLWLKTPYRVPARHPVDQVAPRAPHLGSVADDPKDLWRIPTPWTHSGYWIQQWQGDAIGFPGFNRTVDMDTFNTTRQGGQGPHVEWLQRKLSRVGSLGAGIAVSGIFDAATDAAVRSFQGTHGLTVDGVVGPATFAALAWSK